jgi:hypothetical protein
MNEVPDYRDWHTLFCRFSDGTLPPEERERLEQILATHPEARLRWFLHSDIEIGLADWAATQKAHATTRIPGRTGFRSFLPSFSPNRHSRTVRWSLALTALTAVLAIGTFTTLWLLRKPVETPVTGVAVLSRLAGVEWADGAEGPVSGSLLNPGTLRLRSGAILLEFRSGARLIVEGPAEIRLISPSLAFLQEGRASAIVPPQTKGFTISLPDFKVVDLGTEFGVVNSPEAREIHVFAGAAEFAARNASDVRTLLEGRALAHLQGQWREIKASRRGFLTEQELARWESTNQRERMALSRSVSNRLSSDPTTRVHFVFEATDSAERVLPNAALHGGSGSDGSLVGSIWIDGRWPGKPALRFRGPGDRVRFTVPDSLHQVTLLAWIRLDALPTSLQSLCSSDLDQEGALHWEWTGEGRLRLVFGRSLGRKETAWHAIDSDPVLHPGLIDQWIFVTTTFDGGHVQHYLNGKPAGEKTPYSAGEIYLGPSTLGNWEGGSARNLTGAMDEFAVLSKALTAEQIQELYLQGKP